MTNIQLICPSTNINSSLFRGNGLTAADIATECKLQVDTLSVFAVVLGTNDKDPNTKYPHSYLPSLSGGTTLYVEGTPTAQGAPADHRSLDERLTDLVSSAGQSNISPHVIDRCFQRFPQQCSFYLEAQDKQRAKTLYEEAERLPQTATEEEFFKVEGFVINGPLGSSSSLVICFDENAAPCVLKTLSTTEKERIQSIPSLNSQYIIKYSLKQSHRGNALMIMPLLPTTLEHMQHLSTALSGKLWKQMSDALSCLHGHGFAHMDVKPSNICINGVGDFILIDLGSVVQFGRKSSSTAAYIPRGLTNYQNARREVDWWMLAATLGDRGRGMSWGTGANPTKEALCLEMQHLMYSDEILAKLQD